MGAMMTGLGLLSACLLLGECLAVASIRTHIEMKLQAAQNIPLVGWLVPSLLGIRHVGFGRGLYFCQFLVACAVAAFASLAFGLWQEVQRPPGALFVEVGSDSDSSCGSTSEASWWW